MGLLTLLVLTAATQLMAQETGTPVYSAPYRAFASHELGLSLSAPPGADIGIEGFYGFASGRHDGELRLGYLDRGDRDGAVAVGGRFRTRLLTHSEDFPLDGALTVGVGATFNAVGATDLTFDNVDFEWDYARLRIQVTGRDWDDCVGEDNEHGEGHIDLYGDQILGEHKVVMTSEDFTMECEIVVEALNK